MEHETEYRIVCAHYGRNTGHSTHAYRKKDLPHARQEAKNANHRAEISTTGFYRREAPWRIEQRPVVKWTVVEAEDLELQ